MVQKLPDSVDLSPLLRAIDADSVGVKIMSKKQKIERFLIKQLKTPAANILKQDALSIGAEFAVPASTISCLEPFVDGVLFATKSQLERLVKKESIQPFGLKELSNELRGFLVSSRFPTKIMGVLNINSDSFNPASRVEEKELMGRIEEMIKNGADIIDIGALSSRPNSEMIAEEEELERVARSIDMIYASKLTDQVIFSIDSYAPKVLEYALDRGFGIVNDITGGTNQKVLEIASRYDAELVIMHMQGTPQTMQSNPTYKDVVLEIDQFFRTQVANAQKAGVKKLILDAGIGFGKTLDHNLVIIASYGHFLHHGYPLLIGASRKSMISQISPSEVQNRLSGTLAIHLKAVENGASIVRTHDVYEHHQALQVQQAINGVNFYV